MKNVKTYILSTVCALGLACLVSGLTYSNDVLAADGCSHGLSKNAVLQQSDTGGYPASCKINACKTISLVAKKTHSAWDTSVLPPVFRTYVDFKYRASVGAAPANLCPADVNAAVWAVP